VISGVQPNSDGTARLAPAAIFKNSLRFIERLAVKLVPDYFAEPTGEKGKEEAHGKSDSDDLRTQKLNFHHYNPLQSK
jgi:hypothetical protein